ncbi:MAG: heme-binding protein [Deltaproteobacteria bacterium]|nr:heme-binding protein [Deltaproteobacteria bacterium]
MEDINLQQAQKAVDAALEKARKLDVQMNIAVVDAGANLKAFVRIDGAWLGSIDIAIKKARTARFFNMNSGEIGKLSQPGGPLYNIEHSNNDLTPIFAKGESVIIEPKFLPQLTRFLRLVGHFFSNSHGFSLVPLCTILVCI